MLAYYYIAETNISYLTKEFIQPHLLKVLMMVVIMYGSINQAKLAWNIGDLGVGLMAWFNIIAILLLQKPALLALNENNGKQERSCFNPEDMGCQMPIFGIR
jgi:AGCS family alanine or glycine:cation symporter